MLPPVEDQREQDVEIGIEGSFLQQHTGSHEGRGEVVVVEGEVAVGFCLGEVRFWAGCGSEGGLLAKQVLGSMW